MRIQPIVEGHGDVAALPVLLRRLIKEAQTWSVDVGRPIRVPRGKIVQQAEVERAVRLALLQPECGAVLILFDGDRDCPARLGPSVQTWAAARAGNVPCSVVIAHREYEAWFLAAIESLRGYRGVRDDAETHPNPEGPLCAKGQMEARMHADASYLERIDQPALSARAQCDRSSFCSAFRARSAARAPTPPATEPPPPRSRGSSRRSRSRRNDCLFAPFAGGACGASSRSPGSRICERMPVPSAAHHHPDRRASPCAGCTSARSRRWPAQRAPAAGHERGPAAAHCAPVYRQPVHPVRPRW